MQKVEHLRNIYIDKITSMVKFQRLFGEISAAYVRELQRMESTGDIDCMCSLKRIMGEDNGGSE